MEWITSDTHFFHHNICGGKGFCSTRKQFKDVYEMNETIVANWNRYVKGNDIVYHLGDVGFGDRKETLVLLERLKGTIFIVKGNHDSQRDLNYYTKNCSLVKNEPKIQIIDMGIRKKDSGVQYYLTHYPQGLGEQRETLRNLCGHIHESKANDKNVLNVGVDSPEIKELRAPFGAPIPLKVAMDLVNDKFIEGVTK